MTTIDDGIKYFLNSETQVLSEILYDTFDINAKDFEYLLKFGAIYVNNERQTKDGWIHPSSQLRVHTKPRRYNCHYNWNALVVFENDFCLVLNKPSGIPSHPSVDNIIENALTQMSMVRKIPLFVTHRLDTLTSGLIVYGKKQSFVKSFNIQIQERTIHKKYVALVESHQTFSKKLTHYMNPTAGTPKKLSDSVIDGWSICELEILEQKEFSPQLSWIKINLLTGRTHQIRSQLSQIGAPIIGDTLYGSQRPFQPNAIALRSCEIQFKCGEEHMKFNIHEDFEF
jgi:23S rRNA pseudouridine1911/1915/1917 synthase